MYRTETRPCAAALARKATATAIAALLACSLTPAAAMGSVTAGQLPQDAPAAVQAQAKKVKVYVLAETSRKGKVGSTRVITEKYSYNKKGLLAKATETAVETKRPVIGWTIGKPKTIRKRTWAYNKDGSLKGHKDGPRSYAYKVDGGRIVSATVESGGGKTGLEKSVERLSLRYDALGRVSSVRTQDIGIISYAYDASGRVVTEQSDTYPVLTWRYGYDSKGNMKKKSYLVTAKKGERLKGVRWAKVSGKLTYSKGRVAKGKSSGKQKEDGSGVRSYKNPPIRYKYRAVKVPASAVPRVKAQQWVLVNGDLDLQFALGEGGSLVALI